MRPRYRAAPPRVTHNGSAHAEGDREILIAGPLVRPLHEGRSPQRAAGTHSDTGAPSVPRTGTGSAGVRCEQSMRYRTVTAVVRGTSGEFGRGSASRGGSPTRHPDIRVGWSVDRRHERERYSSGHRPTTMPVHHHAVTEFMEAGNVFSLFATKARRQNPVHICCGAWRKRGAGRSAPSRFVAPPRRARPPRP